MVTSPTASWNLPAPTGIESLRDDLPVSWYQQDLPHLRQDGATYFVTIRLADSLPQSKLRELRQFRNEWLMKHPPPRSHALLDELSQKLMRRVERWLDQNMGSCLLRQEKYAFAVAAAMRRDDGLHHELGCYVVMPNHVHAIVRPLTPKTKPLETLLQIWKGKSARDINLIRDSSGTIWQRESFDRIVRDPEHLYRVIQYIGRNPAKAGLATDHFQLWIRQSWVAQGWNFEKSS
jgi:REP element-mobilizing transposase RayT